MFGSKVTIFWDADTKIKNINEFINRVEEVFEEEEVVAGYPQVKIFPNKLIFQDYIFHTLYRLFTILSFYIGNPAPSGQCQIIRRSAFKKIKGYNENIGYREDLDIAQRLNKIGKSHLFFDITCIVKPVIFVSLFIKTIVFSEPYEDIIVLSLFWPMRFIFLEMIFPW